MQLYEAVNGAARTGAFGYNWAVVRINLVPIDPKKRKCAGTPPIDLESIMRADVKE